MSLTTFRKSMESKKKNKMRLKKRIQQNAAKRGGFVCGASIGCPVQLARQCIGHDALEHKPIFSAGYKAIMHLNTCEEECVVMDLVQGYVKGKPSPRKPAFIKVGETVKCVVRVNHKVCAESFDDMPQLGRFTMRDEGTCSLAHKPPTFLTPVHVDFFDDDTGITIAVGKVVKIREEKKK